MKQLLQLYFFFFLSIDVCAQYILSGRILDENDEPLIGANVYLGGTYDGATSNVNGLYEFETSESGAQVLIISFIGYAQVEYSFDLVSDFKLDFSLMPSFNAMNAVTISAGAFEASDEKKAVVLNSIDIAMTAGSTADIAGALSTLPGTQKNAQNGRLFVRGGTADETKVFIDGVEAGNFFSTTGNSLPTRSRFSPFLFKGTFFSTGGYTAEYGQAMSSALILQSKDVDLASRYDISIMSVGLDVSTVQVKDDRSFYAKVGYTDLSPYTNVVPQRMNWKKSPITSDGVFSWKQDFDNGAKLRSLAMASRNEMHLIQPTVLNEIGSSDIEIKNDFAFAQVTYDKPIDNKNILSLGLSSTINTDDFIVDSIIIKDHSDFIHLKVKWDHTVNERTFLKTGIDFFDTGFDQEIMMGSSISSGYQQKRMAIYSELDHYLSENLVIRSGLRLEKDALLNEATISPRLSLAYKLNDSDQLSFATGRFFQDPGNDFLKTNTEISQERADHYMVNFQRVKGERIFRIEGYLKDYDQLISYTDKLVSSTIDNSGFGYAYGLDFFWRDRGGIKNIDYWVTYSYLNSERKFHEFATLITPSFATEHNVSIVAKRWFSALKTQMGISYSYSSGRPYDHPEKIGLNESLTQGFHDLSYNMAWLPNQHLIVYLSVSNVLGFDQVFGYNFSNEPNNHGKYESEAIQMPAPRFLFLGCFLTFGQPNDQLENL